MILKIIKKLNSIFIIKPVRHIQAYFIFLADYKNFKNKSGAGSRFKIKYTDTLPQLYDKTSVTPFDAHYIYHPAWAARIVKQLNPEFHVDISSTLTFCSILSTFIPVHFYDYRPANLKLSNLKSEAADLMALPFQTNSINSLSCMHTVEHIGLGRYGEPLDPEGDLKAIKELKRVTARGGSLLFVTPIGKPKLAYNAHRIYSYAQIISYFEGFELKEFSLVPDDGQKEGLIKNSNKEIADKQNYGCGCFWFVKKNEQ